MMMRNTDEIPTRAERLFEGDARRSDGQPELTRFQYKATSESVLPKPATAEDRVARSTDWTDVLLEELGSKVTPEMRALRDRMLKEGAAVLREREDHPGRLMRGDKAILLEAIIATDGTRPVFLIQDGALNPKLLQAAEDWKAVLTPQAAAIGVLAGAVGRVNDPSADQRYQGTAFAVASGLVMTNRHVLQAIAQQTDGGWRLKPDIHIDFAREYDRTPVMRFDVAEVVYAGPAAIDLHASLDHRKLDLALLRLATGDRPWPDALPISLRPETYDAGRMLAVCGFPGDPGGTEPSDLLDQLFRLIFGYKVLSPGELDLTPGEVKDGGRRSSIGHDATTLGGNSGSPVFDIRRGALVAGLHYGGGKKIMNYAHTLKHVLDEEAGDGLTLRDVLTREGAQLT